MQSWHRDQSADKYRVSNHKRASVLPFIGLFLYNITKTRRISLIFCLLRSQTFERNGYFEFSVTSALEGLKTWETKKNYLFPSVRFLHLWLRRETNQQTVKLVQNKIMDLKNLTLKNSLLIRRLISLRTCTRRQENYFFVYPKTPRFDAYL